MNSRAEPGRAETGVGKPAATGPTSFWSAAARVMDLSVGEMLWSRRTIFMALVVAGPVAIAAVTRLVAALGLGDISVDRVRISGPTLFGLMVWVFYLRFTVPVLAVFYGTALIADEVEDKTITYLFTRPVPRGAVLAGKFLAYLLCTVFVVLPSIVVVYLLVVPMGGSLGQSFPDLVTDLGLLALGLAVYGAVFAFVGAFFKRPLLTGLIAVFGWEPTALVIPGYARRFTVAYYLQGLVPHAMPQDTTLSLLQGLFRQSPGLVECLVWLAIIGIGFFVAAVRAVERREYVLEQ
jgi:ABC-type transport system involved in multi-copper enzyme maturation permease subunit